MIDKHITSLKLSGKSKEKQFEIARVIETKEHLKQAYKECEPFISKSIEKGLKCVCSKLQRKKWLHENGIRIGIKHYGAKKYE